MSDQVTPQQIEQWVAIEDYHAALQALDRPRFEPGDGSWSEWIMREMHRAHYQRCVEVNSKPVEYQDVDLFLRKVSLNTISKEDHERCWLCYTHLCHLNGEPAHPVVYHAVFFDASPMELAMTLAQRGDDEGLEIMLHHFGHMLPKLHLVDHFPAILPAYQYARFVLDDPTVDDDWFHQHLQNRYECAGRVFDWIDLLEQHRPDSSLLETWRRLSESDGSCLSSHERSSASNGKYSESQVSTDNAVERTVSGPSVEMTNAQETQVSLLPRSDSFQTISAFAPIVTPDRDHLVGLSPIMTVLDRNESGMQNVNNDSQTRKVECCSATALENFAVENFVPLEAQKDTRCHNANDNDQGRQGSTVTPQKLVSTKPESPDDNGEKQQDKQEIAEIIADVRDCVDDPQFASTSQERLIVRQPVFPSEVAVTYTPNTAGEESADGQRNVELSEDKNRGVDACTSSSTTNKSADDEVARKLRRELSDCISLVKTLVDNLQSQELVIQHDVVSGLQDLRKRLKRMRRVQSVPASAKSGDHSLDALDKSEPDQGTVVALRMRVQELEKVVSQYQSLEGSLPNREDQAGQDTHEMSSVDVIGNQELIVDSLKDQLAKLKNEYEMEKRADTARVRYLQQLLMEREQLSAATPSSDGGSPFTCSGTLLNRSTPRRIYRSPRIPDSPSMEAQLQDLAYALELSEQQRAQALEELQQEREFYAAKVRSLQLAFRDMMGSA